MTNTNKVSVTLSRTTGKQLVKISQVTYGYIDNGKLIIDRNATQSVMHSLTIFAIKNNLIAQ